MLLGRTAQHDVRLGALRAPLALKLVGANMLAVAVLFVAWLAAGAFLTLAAVAVLAAVVGIHIVLVIVALRPIRDLELVAARAWRGDFGARVKPSAIADTRVLRIGSMFNLLLNGLAADRARLRALTTETMAAGDRQLAGVARELHECTAQRVAALLLQLSAAARDTTDPELARRLREARDAAQQILDEVRNLSNAVHSSVLEDLGLVPALRKLARDASSGNGIDVEVDAVDVPDRLPANVEAVLFHVAEEAVRNATRHASPRKVCINVFARPRVTLEIHDDGCGFDLDAVDQRAGGVGLLAMRERVAMIDGWLDIKTMKGNGTTVSATVPLTQSGKLGIESSHDR